MTRIAERHDGVTTGRVTGDAGPPTTTDTETTGASSIGGVLAVLVVIVALAIAAFVFLGLSRADNANNPAVAEAAATVTPTR